jgi:RimJ/RimL family protein N-acetyltransferase
MNADPVVMEHFPATYDRRESDAIVERFEAHFDARGFGFWAMEIPGVAPFAGFVGLSTPTFEAHFTPAVEVGWRLAREHWGQGYATEGARAAVSAGFDELGLEELVAFTVPPNFRSRRVMVRIGMTHDPADDFDHPRQPVGSPFRRHVLYRLAATEPGSSSPPAA